MTDLTDDLRIIATETGRLSIADRAMIARAANDLEMAIHHAISLNAQLIEANGHRIALSDQLIAERRKAAPAQDALPWSMSTGWQRCEFPR
jgi:hypothetical protein